MARMLLWTLWVAIVAGCGSGSSREATPLRLEELPDTAGVSAGTPLLAAVEPRRAADGVVRIAGTLDLPDGTRVQISVYRWKTDELVARMQTTVMNRRFESPPVRGPDGPLARGRYRVEYLAHFNSAWQPPEVLEATDDGRRLRGPGVTRDRTGNGAFYLTEDRQL